MKYKDFYSELMFENLQLSDKLYFNTGILDSKWREFILKITDGDHTTRLICDMVANHIKNNTTSDLNKKSLELFHKNLKNYDKNTFPIIDLDFNKTAPQGLFDTLYYRDKVITEFKKFPNIASRNLKSDIRIARNRNQLQSLTNTLHYINISLGQLDNRSDELKEKMYKKVFSSDNTSFDDITRFLDEKENIIGGSDFNREDIMDLVNKHKTPIIYDKNGVIIIDIRDKEEMIDFGQNALWCFTYGKPEDYEVFDNYSTNGHVYLIINTRRKSDDRDFMYVLIKPIPQGDFFDFFDHINKQKHFDFSYEIKSQNYESDVLYDLTNQPVTNPLNEIYNIVKGDFSVFNLFTFEDN